MSEERTRSSSKSGADKGEKPLRYMGGDRWGGWHSSSLQLWDMIQEVQYGGGLGKARSSRVKIQQLCKWCSAQFFLTDEPWGKKAKEKRSLVMNWVILPGIDNNMSSSVPD